MVLRQEHGQYIDETNGRKNLYFRDGDGHLLEIIAHDYVNEDELKASGMLRTLYLREIGFPVDSVPSLRDWLKSNLGMKTEQDQDIFNFVISGTAHAIVVSKQRPWIPIAMKALPPKMAVTFGTPDKRFIDELTKQMDHTFLDDSKKRFILSDGYPFYMEHTPEFSASMVKNLNLPI